MVKRYLLGLDVGSSSVKASVVDSIDGKCCGTSFFPKQEAPIKALRTGWAEQAPGDWWQYAKDAIAECLGKASLSGSDIAAIGISYQMHGLVCVDKQLNVLRDSIIWCDSRAVAYGERAFRDLGAEKCLGNLLNSPGNFTAAKLAWVRENEPDIYHNIYKVMLPGDYIAMKLSGEVSTTISGLSEGMMWDFGNKCVADFLLDYYGIDRNLVADIVPTFGIQSKVNAQAAKETGIAEGTPICYRAGDQPNNALSLNVFNPGEVASTAGTSGVVYGVSGVLGYDTKSRVNTFAHVNYSKDCDRLGILLCINGTGILNAWARRNIAAGMSYSEMNDAAASVPVGAEGVSILPFGNGAERMLENREPGCSIHGLNFNKHDRRHLLRAAQEGIVFAFCQGMDIMRQMGMDVSKIHAGNANMFLSPLFRKALAATSGATIELYDTDGSIGAARGAGIGCGIYADHDEAFATLERKAVIMPDESKIAAYQDAFDRWKDHNDIN
ncbi:MAG: xylulokinase [Prevotella sp.]